MTSIVDEMPSALATVQAAVDGDEEAFTRIVATYHSDMVRVCYVISGDAVLAQEAAQAAWPIVWRKLRSLRDPERIRPWLVSVAANEVRLLIRRRRRRAVREIAIEAADESGLVTRGDPSERAAEVDLTNALGRLSPDDRVVVALRYVMGMNSTEIGLATGLLAAGARTRLARALARLRKDLADD